ncbi:hypothetical protein LVD17_14025 [Fulvivirga ulvae]|uniref:hypothetical protein n=1 Tax=Fulvivirga ulvae TaxID=2904245 RepID=UPI001F1D4E67|nr:hypothetical protein [Fulvivirga ulvae]UII34925.1 hypothetical protein LVD17_14025 [Fulvivirga ulvae]
MLRSTIDKWREGRWGESLVKLECSGVEDREGEQVWLKLDGYWGAVFSEWLGLVVKNGKLY